MKTIKEWLETLDEPERTQALANVDPRMENAMAIEPCVALFHAFSWGRTPEGVDYWKGIYEKIYAPAFSK